MNLTRHHVRRLHLNPTKYVMDGLIYLHHSYSMPWEMNIFLLAASLKLCFMPLTLFQQRSKNAANIHRPHIENERALIKRLQSVGDHEAAKARQYKLGSFMKLHSCHPTSLFKSFIPMPFYMTAFLSVNGLVDLMKQGIVEKKPFLWIESMASYDSLYVLPLACSLTMVSSLSVCFSLIITM